MRYCTIIVFLLLCFTTALCQEPVEVKCGDIIENTFTKNKQVFKYHVKLDGGDRLKIYAKGKHGELLRMTYEIYGPSGTKINGTFERSDQIWKNVNQVTTAVLPATGYYQILIYNHFTSSRRNIGTLGEFIFEVSCIKHDGTVIEFGQVDEDEKQNTKNTPPSSALKIPIGTQIEGSISPGSGENYAFKTSFTKEKPISIMVNIIKGSTPIQVIITNERSKEIVFKSTLKFSKSMNNTMVFPEDGNYIIVIKEEGKNGSSGGRTDFTIKLANN